MLSSDGRTVTARLDAVQADGTTRVFQGEYTVSGGETVAAAVHEVGSPKPAGTGYPDCTAAHSQGVYDIPWSDPAYRPELDSDNDGVACEHYGDNEGHRIRRLIPAGTGGGNGAGSRHVISL